MNVKHAQALTTAFQAAGIRADYVTCRTPVAKRTEILEKFRDGRLSVRRVWDTYTKIFNVLSKKFVVNKSK